MLKKYLLAPGPTPVPPEVLLAMAQPIIHHRTPQFEAIFAEDETPANWKNFIELNKQFFKDNPGVKPATKS